jgi:hypothetical protein
MKKITFLLLFVYAAGVLAGAAAAQTQIIAPSAGITDPTLLPLNVSGLSTCPGIEFELRYDSRVIAISGVTSAPRYRGTMSVVPNINNAAGTARVIVISTSGITADTPVPLLMINVSVNGTGYTPLEVQNAKWVRADFNSVPFDTVENGLITTNGATVPPAVTPTTLPSPPPTTAIPAAVQATFTEYPTLDLPTPSGTVTTEPAESPAVTATATLPVPERTMVLFSPAPAETATAGAPPAEMTTAPGAAEALPTATQKSGGFSFPVAFTAAGIAALAYLGRRRV